MNKVWMITGAAKGIGYSIAKAALENGDYIVATTRVENDFAIPNGYEDKVLALQLDVSCQDFSLFESVVKQAVEKFSCIDYLVNNAGRGRITNFEETSEEHIKELFETNFFGMMRVTRAVLPVMRKQKSGYIFNVASGAGYAAGPVGYHSSKFAVTGFSTALSFEVAPLGIKVTNVVPGMTRTNFYAKGSTSTESDFHIADYDPFRWQEDFMRNNSNHEQMGDPDKIGQLIVKVAYGEKAPLHLPVTEDAVDVLLGSAELMKECADAYAEDAKATSF